MNQFASTFGSTRDSNCLLRLTRLTSKVAREAVVRGLFDQSMTGIVSQDIAPITNLFIFWIRNNGPANLARLISPGLTLRIIEKKSFCIIIVEVVEA